jgi:hypothetical protein
VVVGRVLTLAAALALLVQFGALAVRGLLRQRSEPEPIARA